MTEIIERSDPNDSSTGNSYETICHTDGRLGCNCRGWATKKLGKARTCKHVDALVAKYGFVTDDSGDWRKVFPPLSPAGLSVPIVSAQTSPTFMGAGKKTKPTKAKAVNVPAVPAPVVPNRPRFNIIQLDDEDTAVYVKPMLASPFPDGQTLENFCASSEASAWVMEEKYDGERMTVTVNEGVVRAWARPQANKEPIPRVLPEHLVKVLSTLPTCTLDTEEMIDMPGARSNHVKALKHAGQEILMVFDILSLLGTSLVTEPYDVRRTFLVKMFASGLCTGTGIRLSDAFPPSPAAVQAIWDRDGEGVILKRRAARYQPGARSRDWIKVKNLSHMLMVVTGYAPGKNGPYSRVVVKPKHASDGTVGTTVKARDNDMLRAFAADPDAFIGRGIWIEYQERTADGSFRSPRIDRWENE